MFFANWPCKANIFFTILIFEVFFIPYQLMLYLIVIILKNWVSTATFGADPRAHHLWHADPDLLFRNQAGSVKS